MKLTLLPIEDENRSKEVGDGHGTVSCAGSSSFELLLQASITASKVLPQGLSLMLK